MKATSPADAVGIMMKVFPADSVGIQVISCSVLHILLLLRWNLCSELLHNTNPAAKCQQKLFRSAMQIRMQTQSGSRLHARVPAQLVQQLAMATKKMTFCILCLLCRHSFLLKLKLITERSSNSDS